MTTTIYDWAVRWGVPQQALAELMREIGAHDVPRNADGSSEARVQSEIRLEAPGAGVKLWRNNVGVLRDDTGRPVRYGLANDSPALNARIKSADLIGWRRVVITPAHVGQAIAQFVSRECKPSGWRYAGTDREQAQAKWAAMVTLDGGDACFATGKGTL